MSNFEILGFCNQVQCQGALPSGACVQTGPGDYAQFLRDHLVPRQSGVNDQYLTEQTIRKKGCTYDAAVDNTTHFLVDNSAAVVNSIDSGLSGLQVTFQGATGGPRTFSASVAVVVGNCNSAGVCPIAIRGLGLSAGNFEVDGQQVDVVELGSLGSWEGTMQPNGGFVLTEGIRAALQGSVEGEGFSYTARNGGNPPSGVYNPLTGHLVLRFDLVDQRTAGNTLSAAIVGDAPTTQRPVVVNAGTDQSVECDARLGGAEVTLTAQPEGLFAYRWYEGSVQLSDQRVANVRLSLGDHELALGATDQNELADSDSVLVSVVDTSPPEILIDSTPIVQNSCLPTAQGHVIPIPAAVDCSGVVSVLGDIVAINGKPIPRIPILPGQPIVLPTGTHTIEWRATDVSGRVGLATQSLIITEEVREDCCSANQTRIVGTDGAESITPQAQASYCILAKGGSDQVVARQGNDFLAGGSGQDAMVGGGGTDVLVGGSDGDQLVGNTALGGVLFAYGSGGDDALQANFSNQAQLYGGKGNDQLVGSVGQDTLYPGPGVDYVYGGGGGDRIVLLDECEAVPGKVLDGGPGTDVLVSPLSRAALTARGVQLISIETVEVSNAQFFLSECWSTPPVLPPDCSQAPQWAAGSIYAESQRVQSGGVLYECKPWPYSGWCGQTGYQPGVDPDWRDAWIRVGPC